MFYSMNDMLKLNKELIKLVNKCFNVNVNKFKFLTKANYGKGCICLIHGYEGKKFGIIITDKDMIIFCELIPGEINSPIVTAYEDELLQLTFNLCVGIVVAEYHENETKVSIINCNSKVLSYGNKEHIYDGKMFNVDEILIVSKLEGF